MPKELRISKDALVGGLEKLGKIGVAASGGRTRLALTDADFTAREYLISLLENLDLSVRIDQVGNIIGRREGCGDKGMSVVAIGSHIDTVPDAGMFDGCYGVLAAVEVIRTMNENDVGTLHPIEVISFSNEEGVRFPGMTGSKAASGIISLDAAYSLTDDSGITYRTALGKDVEDFASLVPVSRKPGELKCWLELHIEQGPVLESSGARIGVVDVIVGIRQARITILGQATHAGTTPMNSRRDALVGAAKVISEVNRMARDDPSGIVGTVGFVHCFPGAFNVVPGRAELGVDLRHIKEDEIQSAVTRMTQSITDMCDRLGLKVTVNERSRLLPVSMSESIMDTITAAAREVGANSVPIHSGAGHDTQNVARICDAGMIFVPSKGGVSHSPDEWTDPQHLETGANVLLKSVLSVAGARI